MEAGVGTVVSLVVAKDASVAELSEFYCFSCFFEAFLAIGLICYLFLIPLS